MEEQIEKIKIGLKVNELIHIDKIGIVSVKEFKRFEKEIEKQAKREKKIYKL